jgi:pyruvate dehydrogenase E1 component
MLHPAEPPKKSYVEELLRQEPGAFIAVSDNVRSVPDQIAPWVPGGLTTLGTDGYGRSDTRENLRRFFEVDAELTVIATLYALAEKGAVEMKLVAKAIQELDVSPEKAHAVLL